jgi:hypothetical protein
MEESLNLYYDLFGYDKKVEPKLNELGAKGISRDYVFRETKRGVASAENRTKIHAGVGFDIPGAIGTSLPIRKVSMNACSRRLKPAPRGLWSPADTRRCGFPT